mgnify:CR=1
MHPLPLPVYNLINNTVLFPAAVPQVDPCGFNAVMP